MICSYSVSLLAADREVIIGDWKESLKPFASGRFKSKFDVMHQLVSQELKKVRHEIHCQVHAESSWKHNAVATKGELIKPLEAKPQSKPCWGT